MNKTLAKTLASLGSGGISAILMAIIVGVSHLNVASLEGGAVTLAVGTVATAIAAAATRALGGPAPLPPTS